MIKILKIVALVIVSLVLAFALFLGYSTVTNYTPQPIEEIAKSKGQVISVKDSFEIFNWNIGYCGLGNDMSFFYDGGEKVRTSVERTALNAEAIMSEVSTYDSVDFYLFQEVDLNSKRSYGMNQYEMLQALFEGAFSSFAYNYKVDFVPIPPTEPLGKVKSGLASFSKHLPFQVHRHAFQGNYSWPMGIFMLDRCFMVQRFYTSNGKELLIINTHNSAYDDGTLRTQQMELLKLFLISEYEKGNYVVVGGDWNQLPPNDLNNNDTFKDAHLTRLRIDSGYLPEGWIWSFCEKTPTNRMLNEVYNPKTTVLTTIDYFLSSPNIEVLYLKNIDLNFENSDHSPVLFSFTFIE